MTAESLGSTEIAPEPQVERQERRPLGLDGYLDFPDGKRIKVQVADLSYDGCGILSPVELTPGQSIKLSVLRRGAIDAEIRWYSDGKAGLQFTAVTDPKERHRPRAAERISLTGDVTLRGIGKEKYRVRMFDLSPNGCKVELVDRPRVGDPLLIKFSNLEALQAKICWIEGSHAGLRFDRAIHPAVFDLLIDTIRISAEIAGLANRPQN